MKIILFDHPDIRNSLLPLTFTRPVATIRCGILTIAEKWSHYLSQPVSFLTEEYLRPKYPFIPANENLLINGAVLPDSILSEAVLSLKLNEGVITNGEVIAARIAVADMDSFISHGFKLTHLKLTELPTTLIKNTWHIFHFNGEQIKKDFEILTKGRTSGIITDKHTIAYSPENIFVEEGVKVKASILNAEDGPIYLGKNSEIQEGAMIRGPFALGEGAVINMGAKIHGDSTFGPYCKVGGEVANSVLFGYSNKGHDGYLGNSVIGEWCNLGADTNTSNLKNNYKSVKVWSYLKDRFEDSGLQFCGLTMGDHSKSGINTMFNTGTVVGVSANIFGSGFPRAMVPSFSWGGASGFTTFGLKQAFEVAEAVMKRRGIPLEDVDKMILAHIFELSAKNKVWERFGGY